VKLKSKFNAKLRKTLKVTKCEDKGCICELEQGQILGEDEYEGGEIDEIQESHIFKFDNLCMNVGFAKTKNEEQLLKTIM